MSLKAQAAQQLMECSTPGRRVILSAFRPGTNTTIMQATRKPFICTGVMINQCSERWASTDTKGRMWSLWCQLEKTPVHSYSQMLLHSSMYFNPTILCFITVRCYIHPCVIPPVCTRFGSDRFVDFDVALILSLFPMLE